MAPKIKIDVYYIEPLSSEAREFFGDITDEKGHSYEALSYCDSVQTGETIVCNLVRRAVCRQYRDIERDCKGDTIYYDPAAGDRIVDFVQLMPHVKGPLARTPLLLEPWQKFVLTTTFGWKVTETHQRRFRRIYIEVPRGNGKSALSSPVGLYGMTADNEMGAEIYSAATSRDQAKIVFDVAKMMANMAKGFKTEAGVGCFAHHMEHSSTGSFFRPLSTEGNHLDGLNIHIGIIDELHAHKTREVYDVLVTGIGKRLQSMIWMITTAGFDTGGVCYEERTYMESVLLGKVDDDSVFGVMYTLDPWDDWTQPEAWQKANPCWGTAVRPEIVEQLAKKAMTIPSFQNNFRTKHLNQWMNADSVWMDMNKWDEASMPHVKMDDMEGLFTECFIGIDLASKKDLAAVAYLFTLDDSACEILKIPFDMKYMLFTQFYLPQEAAEQGENSQYLGWAHDGYIKATPGNVTDFATIEEDVIRNCKKFEIEEIAFDPWQSTQMAQNMQKAGLEPIEYRNTVATMSEPMKSFDALISSQKMVHSGNPCMRWNVSNTVCHYDAKDNIYPRKTRVENKIDGVVATIMSLGRATLHDEDNGSAYDEEWEEDKEK